jgi:hypothetical protein
VVVVVDLDAALVVVEVLVELENQFQVQLHGQLPPANLVELYQLQLQGYPITVGAGGPGGSGFQQELQQVMEILQFFQQ